MDHDILVKKKPKMAAKLLDRYRKMVGSLYNTHQVLVEDKAEMLDDLTDTSRRQERAQMTRGFTLLTDYGYSQLPDTAWTF
jgi:hypothetical protein